MSTSASLTRADAPRSATGFAPITMNVVTLKDIPVLPAPGAAERTDGWTGPVERTRQEERQRLGLPPEKPREQQRKGLGLGR